MPLLSPGNCAILLDIYVLITSKIIFFIEYLNKAYLIYSYYKMNSTYMLLDPIESANIFEINGSSILYFNDRTNGTFYDTYQSVKKNKSASKCYYIDDNKMWYQLIYKEQLIFQYSFNGSFIRRIKQVQQLSDEKICELIKVGIHTGTPSTDVVSNPIYDKWEKNILTVLENGSISVDDIKRIIYNTDNISNPPYLGGRWLIGFLHQFTKRNPKYIDIILLNN